MRPQVEAALAGMPMERDADVVHKRLGPRWIHVACVSTFAPSGAADGWIEAIMDVTERRRVQESLCDNQSDLQSVYNTIAGKISEARTLVPHENPGTRKKKGV